MSLRDLIQLITYKNPKPQEGVDDVFDALLFMLGKRREQGLAAYKTPLRTFNGRKSLIDALEESVDQSLYLIQEVKEREEIRRAILEGLDGLPRYLSREDRAPFEKALRLLDGAA